ncbi:glycosyltransferase family A protein [Sphingomonas profundi]|uniref:glycosyltransferase family A protein n=1 Tax=Alterirhizorhabdus profundi TaxID=2681549 RepID=UPI0012E81997|nr:glycosyltransferase family A protein [Sphingomonas profundi]
MATRGRIEPARHAIACFDRQTHAPRELVIACATPGSAVARHVAGRTDVRLVEVPSAATVGALRNAAIAAAAGPLLCVWDDDDLACPDRLAWQVAALAEARAAACVLARVLLWWPARRRLAASAGRMWENSLLVTREGIGAYPDVARGGDTAVVAGIRAARRIVALDRADAYCYVAHGGNLWGERHFEMLFARATQTFSGAAYDAAVERLSALPLDAYAAGLAG